MVGKRFPNGGLQLKDAAVNPYMTISDDEIVDLLFKEDLKLLCDAHAEAYAQKKMAGLLEADLTEFSEHLREQASRKYRYITTIMEMGADRKTRKVFEPLIRYCADTARQDSPIELAVASVYAAYIATGESIEHPPRVSLKR